MQPIQTEYRGVPFRSRTEARWAVYLDEMHFFWNYEPEQHVLGDVRYTPDFWIPGLESFAEVKPCEPTRYEIQKLRRLVRATGKPGLFLIGTPALKSYWQLTHDGGDDERNLILSDPVYELHQEHYHADYQHFWQPLQRVAVERAIRARFDGFDPDRQTINERYDHRTTTHNRPPHHRLGSQPIRTLRR